MDEFFTFEAKDVQVLGEVVFEEETQRPMSTRFYTLDEQVSDSYEKMVPRDKRVTKFKLKELEKEVERYRELYTTYISATPEILARRIRESGLQSKPILTMFDYLDFDEGRDPVSARAWELRPPEVVILMGVAGCGKTTVGEKLAAALGWSFRDADDFHPPENVAKMSARVPLTDADRQPWLAAIRTYIEACLARGERAVVTCSALKESYRQTIVADPARVRLAHPIGDEALIAARISQRHGHFMKPEMLKSQLETLEPPQNAIAVDIAGTPAEIVTQIRRAFSL